MKDYKCNITYVGPNGQLRSTSIVVEANDLKSAQTKAQELKNQWKKARVTRVQIWD